MPNIFFYTMVIENEGASLKINATFAPRFLFGAQKAEENM